MRRRLAHISAATTLLTVLLLGVPLLVYAHHAYMAQVDQTAMSQAQTLESLTREAADGGPDVLQAWLADQGHDSADSVRMPSGQHYGDAVPCKSRPDIRDGTTVIWSCGSHRVASMNVDVPGQGRAEIDAGVSTSAVGEEVRRVLLFLSAAILVLPVLAMLVADRLGRTVVRACKELTDVADRLRRGELVARAAPSGPPEMQRLANTLNTLAARINALIINEREAVADLSHRLRTPITSLMLQAENLADPAESRRLMDGVTDLNNQVSRIIRQARQPIGEQGSLTTRLDGVVKERVDFWSVLAEEQGRPCELRLVDRECRVDVPRLELEAAIDAVLENVFSHTPEGTALRIAVSSNPQGGATMVLEDDGPGFSDYRVVERGWSAGGSSGLGLDIARRTTAMSGGSMTLGRAPTGGASVSLAFGGPSDLTPPRADASGRAETLTAGGQRGSAS